MKRRGTGWGHIVEVVLAFGLGAALAPEAVRAAPVADRPTPEVRQAALAARDRVQSQIHRPDTFGIVDFGIPSFQPRFFILAAQTSAVTAAYLVCHGHGSDPDDEVNHPHPHPLPRRFSNEDCSHASCLGAFVTGAPYDGQHGSSLHLEGLDLTNDRAACRDIVIHGADYVRAELAKTHTPMGRSFGCFAVPFADRDAVINTLRDGVFFTPALAARPRPHGQWGRATDIASRDLQRLCSVGSPQVGRLDDVWQPPHPGQVLVAHE
jgi:hypothetical protein